VLVCIDADDSRRLERFPDLQSVFLHLWSIGVTILGSFTNGVRDVFFRFLKSELHTAIDHSLISFDHMLRSLIPNLQTEVTRLVFSWQALAAPNAVNVVSQISVSMDSHSLVKSGHRHTDIALLVSERLIPFPQSRAQSFIACSAQNHFHSFRRLHRNARPDIFRSTEHFIRLSTRGTEHTSTSST